MKVNIFKGSWEEVTTKKITVKAEWKEFLPDMSIRNWIDTNKKLRLNKRKTCNCCHRNWESLTGNIHFLQTNKGNKIVCDECCKKLVGD